MQQDPDRITLLLISLTEGKGLVLKQSATQADGKVYPVHPDLYRRPGLQILQTTWHPGRSLAITALLS